MPVLDPKTSPEALAIATGAIISGLLDVLVQKNVLTVPEVRGALDSAMKGAGFRSQTPAGFEASQFIAALLRHFSERKV